MATKRSRAGGTSSKKAKWQVSKTTFDKWKRVYEWDYRAMSWLRCSMDSTDKTLVSTLWCAVRKQYESQLESLKNFSRACIDNSTNQKTSNIIDHASSDQHKTAMAWLCKERAQSAKLPVAVYAPIAHSLQSTLDPAVKDKLKNKFDITYVLVKENLLFTKYPAIQELLERYEVPLGFSYKTRNQHRTFYTT